MSHYSYGNGKIVELWKMKEYGVISSWEKIFRINTKNCEEIKFVDGIKLKH
ncbi:hypothetical protein Patl1_25080 [Pistacia atlantica]|uniref:Uncharacterized protein n=1 Tax=Pistacia atlantica TaxID=434234 RepID=A0ACC1B260_9ROSI|nr:hypothetical protein Patl1_25080 [Pistacia atlantica]